MNDNTQEIQICMRNIYVNEISGLTDSSRVMPDPSLFSEVTWNKEEIINYYGRDLTPYYIPEELKEKNWRPEEDKTYKCWWYYTPADSGHDILLYIEEVSDKESIVDEYKEKIISVLSKLSLQQLKDLFEHINDRCAV